MQGRMSKSFFCTLRSTTYRVTFYPKATFPSFLPAFSFPLPQPIPIFAKKSNGGSAISNFFASLPRALQASVQATHTRQGNKLLILQDKSPNTIVEGYAIKAPLFFCPQEKSRCAVPPRNPWYALRGPHLRDGREEGRP